MEAGSDSEGMFVDANEEIVNNGGKVPLQDVLNTTFLGAPRPTNLTGMDVADSGKSENSTVCTPTEETMETVAVHNDPFQTPDRKRPIEVDSKTITRPKKPSSNVVLPEVFTEIKQGTVTPPMSTVAAVPLPQASTVSPSVPSEQDNGKKPPLPSSSRPRQQTMVVTSQLHTQLKMIFGEEKKSGSLDESTVGRIEQKIMAIVQEKEKEWAMKHEKLGQIMMGHRKEAEQKERQMKEENDCLTSALRDLEKAVASGMGSGPSPSFSAPIPAGPDRSAEIAKLKKKEEELEAENANLHRQYNTLYETYNQQRAVIPKLKEGNETLEKSLKFEQDKFTRLQLNAKAKLEQASDDLLRVQEDMARQERKHDDATLSIRMKLRQLEIEKESMTEEIQRKKKELAEVREMCTILIQRHEAGSDQD